MDRLIYVFIEGENIECYPNLKQLTQDHPKISYNYTSKLLKTSSLIKRKQYSIAICRLKYNTNRNFPKDNNGDW